jgi:Tfp pilus assembly protein PilO
MRVWGPWVGGVILGCLTTTFTIGIRYGVDSTRLSGVEESVALLKAEKASIHEKLDAKITAQANELNAYEKQQADMNAQIKAMLEDWRRLKPSLERLAAR